jgi:hypothetical protein
MKDYIEGCILMHMCPNGYSTNSKKKARNATYDILMYLKKEAEKHEQQNEDSHPVS